METPQSKRLRVGDDHDASTSAQKTSKYFDDDLKCSPAGAPCDPSRLDEHLNVEGSPDDTDDDQEEEEEDYYELMHVARRRWTPNQLRGRIRKLLQQTDIKITEFQRMLGVNSNSYNKFMNGKYKHQWSAAENQTYDAAARFFLREEKLGKQGVGKSRAKPKSEVAGCPLPDISDVSTDALTWLTPGETRSELRKILKQYGTSMAALARLANTPMQSFVLFSKAGGDFGGADNQAYHPAAQLVEKFRIVTKKPKSKKRLALEAEVASGRAKRDGQPFLGVDPSGKFLCLGGERPFMARDELGRKIVQYRR